MELPLCRHCGIVAWGSFHVEIEPDYTNPYTNPYDHIYAPAYWPLHRWFARWPGRWRSNVRMWLFNRSSVRS